MFPATILNKANALKMVNRSPDLASVTLEYFSLQRGPKMLYVSIQVKWWIQDLKLKGQIEFVTIFDSVKELEKDRDITQSQFESIKK